MTEPVIQGLSSFSGVGVWKAYKASGNASDFSTRSIVYGYNGAGKTTISRIFSSLVHGTLSPELGDETKFNLRFSDGTHASETDLTHPISNHLLVFNTDFVEENFRWDDSSAEPIFYLDQGNIALLDQLKEAEKQLLSAREEEKTANENMAASSKALREKKTEIGQLVRKAWGNTSYTQRFDAGTVQRLYTDQEFGSESKLLETDIEPLRQIIRQPGPMPKLDYAHELNLKIFDHLQDYRILINKSFSSVLLDDLAQHPDLLSWVAEGHQYHTENKLGDCLHCGQQITAERRSSLEGLFGQTWDEQRREITDAIQWCRNLRQELRSAIEDLPQSSAIQPGLREGYSSAYENFRAALVEVGTAVRAIQELLEVRQNKPVAPLEIPQSLENVTNSWWQNILDTLLPNFQASLKEHNATFDEFDTRRSDAANKIKNHVLFENQSSFRSLVSKVSKAETSVSDAKKKADPLSETCESLASQLRQHGIAAEKLNHMVKEYLGHSGVKLVAKDNGYQFVRPNGDAAKFLSEGEKTAISFCFFLTQFGAEGRERKKLVVVIDDPVSSLDTTAQSYAFGLLKKFTKRVAQVILLTHNLQLMHMAKRQFFQGHDYGANGTPQGLLQVNCTEFPGKERSSSLDQMHHLLARFDTEYQYLFYLVSEADRTKNSPFIFVLPNAMRKLLEIFSAFAAPDKIGFAKALQDSANNLKRIDSAEMTALERLCQIESHGDIEDVTTLPSMTIEESYRAASSALKYIQERDKKHYKAMKTLVKPSDA